jgi:hypothetical protein
LTIALRRWFDRAGEAPHALRQGEQPWMISSAPDSPVTTIALECDGEPGQDIDYVRINKAARGSWDLSVRPRTCVRSLRESGH